MSVELSILKTPFLAKNWIPRGVLFWLFFKSKILERENNRATLENSSLELKDFIILMKSFVDEWKDLPRCCTGSSSFARSNRSEMYQSWYSFYRTTLHESCPFLVRPSVVHNGGLGIFLKRSMDFSDGDLLFKDFLSGPLYGVSQHCFQLLVEKDYPSLWRVTDQVDNNNASDFDSGSILVGPVCLVNEDRSGKGFLRFQ